MTRNVFRKTALGCLLGLAFLGCTDRGGNELTAPAPNFQVSAPVDALRDLIVSLFPRDHEGLRTSAISKLNSIQSALLHNDLELARKKMLTLVDFTLQKFKIGRLLDPNGSRPPTTVEAVCALIDGLYDLVKLPGPGLCNGVFGSDGAAAVIGIAGGTLVTSSGLGGTSVPQGSLHDDVLVVIRRLPDGFPPFHGALAPGTGVQQYPPYYDYATFPAGATLSTPIVVGSCFFTPPDSRAPNPDIVPRLRIGHGINENTEVEILPQAPTPFLNCGEAIGRARGTPNTLGGWLEYYASRLVTVEPAFAVVAGGGLGGLAGSFSPFGIVDPGQ